MDRRFFLKFSLSALTIYSVRPFTSFATNIFHSHSYLFSRLVKQINGGVIGWDFGTGMHNFQYHAFDTKNRYLYTLQHFTKNMRGGKISRFDMDNLGGRQRAIDAQHYDINIGHQMLSVENSSQGTKLWAAKGPQQSLSVVRFDYTPNGLASGIEEYILFDPDVFGSFYLTGNISIDQKWIIVRGKSKEESKFNGMNCIVIFSLDEIIKHGPGDVWSLADKIWTYEYYQNNSKNTAINPQSLFSDGKYIYMLFGPLDIIKPNIVRVYSFSGELLYESTELTLGIEKALTLSNGLSNELEGAQLVQLSRYSKPVLTVGFVQGGPLLYKGIYVIKI